MPRQPGGWRGYLELLRQLGVQFTPEQEALIIATFEDYLRAQAVFVLTHPKEGGTAVFPAGVTEVDFYHGRVTYADNTTADLSNNLESLNEAWMRSLFIETDQTIQISLDGQRTWYQVIQGDYLGITYQEFRQIYVKTTQSTNISLWATTSSEAWIQKLKADSARAAAVYRSLTYGVDCSAGATLETTFTANFEIAGIFIHFDSAVSPTVTLSRDSNLGANYDTVMKTVNVTSGTDVYMSFAKGEARVHTGDTVKLTISAVSANAYMEILTEDV